MSSEPLVFLLKGDDQTLIFQARKKLIDDLIAEDTRSTSVEEFIGGEASSSAILDAYLTPSLFGDRKAVVVSEVGAIRAADAEPLVRALESPVENVALILISGGGQISKKLVDAVRKNGNVIDTAVPTGKARNTWYQEQLSRLPVKFDAEARSELFQHLGEDVSRLFAIAETLASAYGEGATIDRAKIQMFLGQEGSIAPWELTDAIDSGDIDLSLRQLHRMMNAGDRHALVILAILYRHFRAMLTLAGDAPEDEHEAARRLGMAPYPAKKAMRQSEKLGYESIAQAIHLLAEADDAVRGGSGLDDFSTMEVLVARLARLARTVGSSKTSRAGVAKARAALS